MNDGQTLSRGWALAALAIVVLAVAARFWRLSWGLSESMPYMDEPIMWMRYMGDFVPLRLTSFDRPDRTSALLYPTFQGYQIGLATWLATQLGLASPWTDQLSGIAVGRVLAATQSVLVVCLVGLLGARAHSVRAGLMAAALMAVAPVPVMQAHYISTDPLVVFLMTAVVWVAFDLQREGGSFRSFAGGALVGMAFGSKYSGIVAGVAVAWAIAEVAYRERSLARFAALTGWSLAGLLAGVIVACPLCVWRADQLMEMLAFYGQITSFENLLPWRTNLAPGLGELGRPYVYQLAVLLPYAAGWAIYGLGACGVLAALRKRRDFDRLLLVTGGVYLLMVGLSRSFEVRYLLHLVPLVVLLGARFLADLDRRRLALGLFTIVFVYSSLLTFSQISRFSYDQQWAMAHWLGEYSRSRGGDLTIAIPENYEAYMNLKKPLQAEGLSLDARTAGEWLRDQPDLFVLPDLIADAVRTRPAPHLRPELDRIESGDAGYVVVGTWRSDFFSSGLYTALDPYLAGSFTQGTVGFRVFERPGR